MLNLKMRSLYMLKLLKFLRSDPNALFNPAYDIIHNLTFFIR